VGVLPLDKHLRSQPIWGAEVSVEPCRADKPYRVDASGRGFEAFGRTCIDTWGRAPVEPGSGGSFPVVAAFTAAQSGHRVVADGS
jgi:hypothetical protein